MKWFDGRTRSKVLRLALVWLLGNGIQYCKAKSLPKVPQDGKLPQNSDEDHICSVTKDADDDRLLRPFLLKLRGHELIPPRLTNLTVLFDFSRRLLTNRSQYFPRSEGWSWARITPHGLRTEHTSPRMFLFKSAAVYVAPMKSAASAGDELSRLYSEQLLLDETRNAQVVLFEPPPNKRPIISKSTLRLMQTLLVTDLARSVAILHQGEETDFPHSTSCDCENKTQGFVETLLKCRRIFLRKVSLSFHNYEKFFKPKFFSDLKNYKFRVRKGDTEPFLLDMPQKLRHTLELKLRKIGTTLIQHWEKALQHRFQRSSGMDTDNIVERVGAMSKDIKHAARLKDKFKLLLEINKALGDLTTTFPFDYLQRYVLFTDYLGQFYKTNFSSFEVSDIPALTNSAKWRSSLTGTEGAGGLPGRINKTCVGDTFLVSGDIVTTSLLTKLNHSQCPDSRTLAVTASKVFRVDQNLTLSNKNLFVVAPLWVVSQRSTITLPGRMGVSKVSWARSGVINEPVQEKILDSSGEDGGHFLGYGLKLMGGSKMTIVSRGGEGSPGRTAPQHIHNSSLVRAEGGKCKVDDDVIKRSWSMYGATKGGRGGRGGIITLNIEDSPTIDVIINTEAGAPGKQGATGDTTLHCSGGLTTNYSNNEVRMLAQPESPRQPIDWLHTCDVWKQRAAEWPSELATYVFKHDITALVHNSTLKQLISNFIKVNALAWDTSHIGSRSLSDAQWRVLKTKVSIACKQSDELIVALNYMHAAMLLRLLDPSSGPTVIGLDAFMSKAKRNLLNLSINKNKIKLLELREQSDGDLQSTLIQTSNFLRDNIMPEIKEAIESTSKKMLPLLNDKDSGTTRNLNSLASLALINSVFRNINTLFSYTEAGIKSIIIVRGAMRDEVSNAHSRVIQLSTVGKKRDEFERNLNMFRSTPNNITLNEFRSLIEYLKLMKRFTRQSRAVRGNCLECDELFTKLESEIDLELLECGEESHQVVYHEFEDTCPDESPSLSVVEMGCDPRGFADAYSKIRKEMVRKLAFMRKLPQSEETDTVVDMYRYHTEVLTNLDMFLENDAPLEKISTDRLLFTLNDIANIVSLKKSFKKLLIDIYEDARRETITFLSKDGETLTHRINTQLFWISQVSRFQPWFRDAMDILGGFSKYVPLLMKCQQVLTLTEHISNSAKKMEEYSDIYKYIRGINTNVQVEEDMDDEELKAKMKELQYSLKDTIASVYVTNTVRGFQHAVFPFASEHSELYKEPQAGNKGQLKASQEHVAQLIERKQRFEKEKWSRFTLKNFDPKHATPPFFRWNAKLVLGQMKDFLAGKPILLSADILMSETALNALRGKGFQLRFVPKGDSNSEEFRDNEKLIEQAFRDVWVNLTHSGLSRTRYGNLVFRFMTPKVSFLHTVSPDEDPLTNAAINKLDTQGYTLSPFSTWMAQLQWVPPARWPLLHSLLSRITAVELVGRGMYLKSCSPSLDITRYYTPDSVHTQYYFF